VEGIQVCPRRLGLYFLSYSNKESLSTLFEPHAMQDIPYAEIRSCNDPRDKRNNSHDDAEHDYALSWP